MSFADRLIDAVRAKNTPLCIGLDPFADKIPALFGNACEDTSAVLKFSASIIDLAREHAAVIKPQLGLFEQFGEMGYATARLVTDQARAAGLIVILDAKRGDIGTTAEGYARATIGAAPGFNADCVTVNPYLGRDSIEPFMKVAEANAKGVCVLVRTSNPGARDLQDQQVNGEPLWTRTADMILPFVERLLGESGWSGLMAVCGATYPAEAAKLRAILPRALFLVPGYGAQGGTATDAVAGFSRTGTGLVGGVVSASRSVLYPEAAHPDVALEDWRGAIIAALEKHAGELRAACNS